MNTILVSIPALHLFQVSPLFREDKTNKTAARRSDEDLYTKRPVRSKEGRNFLLRLSQCNQKPQSKYPETQPKYPYGQRDIRQTSTRMNPALSKNPFLNGKTPYHHTPGTYLCYKCGTIGHLSIACHKPPLSRDEHDYLRNSVQANSPAVVP